MIFNLNNYPYRNLWYVFFLIIVPVESILGVGGNFLSLLVARKQAKTNGAYELQVYVMLSDLLYSFFALIIPYSIVAFVLYGEGPLWLLQNPYLVFGSANFTFPLTLVCMDASMYLVLTVVCDRLYAMLKPLHYQGFDHVDHRKRALKAALACFLLSLSTNLQHFFHLRATFCDNLGHYLLSFNHSSFLTVMTVVRNLIRALGLAAILVLGPALTFVYWKKKNVNNAAVQSARGNQFENVDEVDGNPSEYTSDYNSGCAHNSSGHTHCGSDPR